MHDLEAHEMPILLLLGASERPADAFAALLGHEEVDCWQLPPPWVLEGAGVDLPSAMPGLGTLRVETLPDVLETLATLCDRERLDRMVRDLWRAVDERVRAFHLRRSTLEILGSIFKMRPRSLDLQPPASFVQDLVHQHAFTVEYRLRDADAGRHPFAPPGEGSLAFYPFDPANASARLEAGLPPGDDPILEAFAYAAGRDRHKAILEEVASSRGWRLLDPLARDG